MAAKVWHRFRGKVPYDWIVDIRDRAGVRHRFSAGTREEADALLVDKTKEYQEPEKPSDAPDKTLDAHAAEWLSDITAEASLKPRTIRSYRQIYSSHIAPTLGIMNLRDIRRRHVKALLTAKRQQIVKSQSKQPADQQPPPRKFSKDTVRLIRACLSVMLAEAVDDELIDSNPTALPARKRGKKKTAKAVAA